MGLFLLQQIKPGNDYLRLDESDLIAYLSIWNRWRKVAQGLRVQKGSEEWIWNWGELKWLLTNDKWLLQIYSVTRVTRKQTLRTLSLSYQKKDGRPSSFGMTPNFLECNLWCQQSQILTSQCHTKRRVGAATRAHPSFGMTKILRSVFSWHVSCIEWGDKRRQMILFQAWGHGVNLDSLSTV